MCVRNAISEDDLLCLMRDRPVVTLDDMLEGRDSVRVANGPLKVVILHLKKLAENDWNPQAVRTDAGGKRMRSRRGAPKVIKNYTAFFADTNGHMGVFLWTVFMSGLTFAVASMCENQ